MNGDLVRNSIFCRQKFCVCGNQTNSISCLNKMANKDDTSKYDTKFVPIETGKLSFDSTEFVGMQEEVRAATKAFLKPLRFVNMLEGSRSLCLYGPPGTGKTFFARALANTTTTKGKVNLFAPSNSEIRSAFPGQTERNLSNLFQTAQKAATEGDKQSGLSFIVFDEFEGIAGNRSTPGNETMKSSLYELLTLMDGIKSEKYSNVVVIATTNLPWVLDPAMIRRFKKIMFVDLPTYPTRLKLIQTKFQQKLGTPVKGKLSDKIEKLCAELAKVSGMQEQGFQLLKDKSMSLPKHLQAIYSAKIHEHIKKHQGSATGTVNTTALFGFSTSDISSFMSSVLDEISYRKLQTTSKDYEPKGCFPICDEKAGCVECNLTQEQADEFKLKPDDIGEKERAFILAELLQLTPTVNPTDYIDFIVYKLTNYGPGQVVAQNAIVNTTVLPNAPDQRDAIKRAASRSMPGLESMQLTEEPVRLRPRYDDVTKYYMTSS